MEYCSILILAIAISVDGFSVGVTYGLRKIKMGFIPLIIISGISTIATYLTISAGVGIAVVLDKNLADNLGSFLLIAIGGWLIYSAYLNHKSINNTEEICYNEDKLLLSLKIKPLGIIIKILKEPTKADFDKSGTINISEAVVLGLALAMDALGVGLGAGLAGFSPYIVPVVIGVTNLLFVIGGFFIGRKMGDIVPDHFEMIPGFIIIFLGIIKLI